ncbi:MAG: 50S ribosomal protein L9 [Saprospiraceae bacterium]|jgi:large subunit ribosomal protein L9
MEIILLQNVDKVGDRHEIVKVKDGFARNYLIPRGVALVANTGNRKRLTDLMRQQAAKEGKMVGEFQTMAETLSNSNITIQAKAGITGRLFGSIGPAQLAAAIRSQVGLDIERKKIVLDDIKEAGAHTATINLHKDVSTTINFTITGESNK